MYLEGNVLPGMTRFPWGGDQEENRVPEIERAWGLLSGPLRPGVQWGEHKQGCPSFRLGAAGSAAGPLLPRGIGARLPGPPRAAASRLGSRIRFESSQLVVENPGP